MTTPVVGRRRKLVTPLSMGAGPAPAMRPVMSDFEWPRNPDGSLRTRKTEENMPGGRGEVYKALHWLNDGMEAGADFVEDGVRGAWKAGGELVDYGGEVLDDVGDTISDGAKGAWNGAKDLFGGLF
jgi:hypothetical protein